MKTHTSQAAGPLPADGIPSPDERMHGHGLRMTDQRRAVYDVVMAERDHPTAVEVFMRVKGRMPHISLATVYNCLETLVDCGLVKCVNHERQSSRYCPNLQEHAHLFCQECGGVSDVPLRTMRSPAEIWMLPDDVEILQQEVSFLGLCAQCHSKQLGAREPKSTRARLKSARQRN